MENTQNTNVLKIEEEPEITPFQKIMSLNKLGCLFLSSDKYDKALSILQKTFDFYISKKENKEIPNFFYSNLYCNLAKAYSCKKEFKEAEKYYTTCIINHPIYKIISNQSEFLKSEFLINSENLLKIQPCINSEIVLNKIRIIMNYFTIDGEIKSNEIKDKFNELIVTKFKPNNLNNLSSFTDSLVNLAVIFQINYKETTTAFDMYYLALLCEPDNNVANINFNNFLREINFKDKSDEYIKKRIEYGYISENQNNENIDKLEINFIKANTLIYSNNDLQNLSFVCMKWGNKYDSDYVNKLYRGIKRNSTKSFNFYCITDNFEGLVTEIRPLKLESHFKGWMRKSILFFDSYIEQITKENEELICFIDLDMIVYSNIDYLWNYEGDFCIIQTNDIQCESSIDGYNSSVILWRKNFGKEIYEYMNKYDKWINNQVIRFDHYLEFIVKNADFIQNKFKGKVLDYNTYCKDKEDLPEYGSIVAFPRNPKPHECKEKWIQLFWI